MYLLPAALLKQRLMLEFSHKGSLSEMFITSGWNP